MSRLTQFCSCHLAMKTNFTLGNKICTQEKKKKKSRPSQPRTLHTSLRKREGAFPFSPHGCRGDPRSTPRRIRPSPNQLASNGTCARLRLSETRRRETATHLGHKYARVPPKRYYTHTKQVTFHVSFFTFLYTGTSVEAVHASHVHPALLPKTEVRQRGGS